MKKTKSTQKKRGVSIVECVIAMLIITIVSVAAVQTAATTMKITTNALRDFECRNLCENAIECFKIEEDADDFAAFLTGTLSLTEDNGAQEAGEDRVFTRTDHKIGIRIAWNADFNTLTVSATRDGAKKPIFQAEYRRGGAAA